MSTKTKAKRPLRRAPAWSVPGSEREFGPADIGAAAAVRALLRSNAGLAEAAAAPGSITVISVPAADWVTPVQEAWVANVHPADGEGEDSTDQDDADDDDTPWVRAQDEKGDRQAAAWYGFARDANSRPLEAAEQRRRLELALHSGKPTYAWSHDPHGLLPSELLRLADRTVTIQPFTPEVLADALTVLTGAPPQQAIPAALARAVGLQDLSLAWRPGETADGVLARLERLRGNDAASPQEVDRLENLLGMDQARDWGLGLVRDLPEYRAGRLRWRDIEDAVLLAGPPGCGKTSFARRLAASLDVPLIVGSPQQWQASRDGHLGHALGAMRATFREARKAAPCVLFLDEIDSMGNRATYADHNRDYSTAYMNGLLEELDGASGLEGVIVVAACNHPSRLDPALTRPGRLNRVLHVGFPDAAALAGILRQRLGGDLAEADLSLVVRHVHQATGADVEAWVRGARSRARHEGRPLALDDLLAQVRPPGDELPPPMRRRAAIHEAGHAVVGWLDRPGSVVRLSLSAGPDAGGVVRSLADDALVTRSGIERSLRRLLAGRAAEELLLGEPSSGAGGPEESDLAQATVLATRAVTNLGLGGTQPLLWRGEATAASMSQMLALQPAVAKEVHSMLAEAHQRAREMLEEHRPALVRVARALLERETIEGDELAALITPPDVLDDGPPRGKAPPR